MKNDYIKTILPTIEQALEKINFGALEIIIHNSKVVQLEVKEKVRFEKNNEQN